MTASQAIRSRRVERDLTQQQLADLMSKATGRMYTVYQIGRLESGRAIISLCDATDAFWVVLRVLEIEPSSVLKPPPLN